MLLLPLLCCNYTVYGQQMVADSNISSSSIDGIEKDSSLVAADSTEAATTSYIRPAMAPAAKQPYRVHPFSAVAVELGGGSLGPGVEIATPLSRSLNLRVGFNLFNFGYSFNIDGVQYDSGLHLRSGRASVDWFPTHRGFHISPGVLYGADRLSAVSGVPPGQYFELGAQGFFNSVDDPLNGTAGAVLPNKFAPMLTLGFGNMIPRSGRHFSFPIEVGAAYVGAPRINVTLNGTACMVEGCFTFANNPDAQSSMQQEIQKLNEKLKRYPVYPILSIGTSYRF